MPCTAWSFSILSVQDLLFCRAMFSAAATSRLGGRCVVLVQAAQIVVCSACCELVAPVICACLGIGYRFAAALLQVHGCRRICTKKMAGCMVPAECSNCGC
jgi:hypothetical protein